MNKTARAISLALASYAAGVVTLSSASDAGAAWRRTHAGVCHDGSDYHFNAYLNNEYVLRNPYPNSTKTVYCPIESDSTLAHNWVTSLWVHAYSAFSGMWVKACVASYYSGSATCGPTYYFGTGYTGVSVNDLVSWQNYGNDFAYLTVSMPGGSQLHGWVMNN